MLALAPIILTYASIAIYLVVLFLLGIVLKRTRGNFKTVLILWLVIVIFSLIRRTLNLLNLADVLNNELWDDLFSMVNAILLLISIYILFREIRSLTDVRLNHSREARRENQYPPPRRPAYENFERPSPRRFEGENNNERPSDGKRRLRVVNGYVDFTND
jgi:predicted membrane protein